VTLFLGIFLVVLLSLSEQRDQIPGRRVTIFTNITFVILIRDIDFIAENHLVNQYSSSTLIFTTNISIFPLLISYLDGSGTGEHFGVYKGIIHEMEVKGINFFFPIFSFIFQHIAILGLWPSGVVNVNNTWM
jgi:hypothetical protein